MILAAGRGERMRPHSDHTPKPLLRAGGRCLVEYHIAALARAGITEIVINLAHLGTRIRDYLGDGLRYGVHIAYSDEGDAGLETGGGIYHALPLLGPEPFIVVNGDIWTDYPLERLTHSPAGLAHLVLVDNPSFNKGGDFALQDGRVVDHGCPRLTYSGIAVLRRELFAGCTPGEFPLAPLLRRAMNEGFVEGEHYTGEWIDVGTPQRLGQLDRRVRQAQLP